MEELTVIEEKFTRCPQCQSFSLKVSDDLTPSEKVKSKWLPITVLKCNNCSYRYVEFGKFSDTLKRIFFSLIGRVERKWLLAVVPAAIIVISIGLFWLLPGAGQKTGDGTGNSQPPVNDKPPVVKVEDRKTEEQKAEEQKTEEQKTEEQKTEEQKTEEQKTEEQKTEEPVDIPPDDKTQTEPTQTQQTQTPEDKKPEDLKPEDQTSPVDTKPEFTYIILGNSNRFGVNWNTVAGGVQIRRLSDGPLKQAGIRIGDILAEVDGTAVANGNRLLRVRNLIFNGTKEEALIKVIRDGATIYFKLVKTVKENAEEQASVAASDAAAQVVKVFAQTTIKVRSSAPDRVSPSLKWCYSQKEINVRRSGNQRVWIAGDASGNGKWAVDDQLIINGRAFDGLTQLHNRESGTFPDWAMCNPLDITSLVPPGQDIKLKIELADFGKHWGNTDIYIIIKPATTVSAGENGNRATLALYRWF